MDLSNIRTLTEMIEFGFSADFSIDKLGIYRKDPDTGIVFLDDLMYMKYIDVIKNNLVRIDYDKSADKLEHIKYAYAPDLLSMDIYGTPMLYHFILLTNDVPAHKFNRDYVYLLPKDKVESIFQSIMIKETSKIKYNRVKTLEAEE